MTLKRNSFIAVLWTNNNLTSGRFEIEAKCGNEIASTTTASNTEVDNEESEEGSGGHFDLNF